MYLISNNMNSEDIKVKKQTNSKFVVGDRSYSRNDDISVVREAPEEQ